MAKGTTRHRSVSADWPSLILEQGADTVATLHLWTQIVGKIRLVQTPWTNHSWHVPLYVTARGLGTSLIPHGNRGFELDFDLLNHQLLISVSNGVQRTIPLEACPVADFYQELMHVFEALDLPVAIHTTPCEMVDVIPFQHDQQNRSYDSDYATRFWQALVQIERVFKEFRARFIGKCSPVHFFWGGFDLAVTRFSGREAPPHPGGVPNCPDWVMREAYSHEVSSAGFWPGGDGLDHAFYSYAYPAPAGFETTGVSPAEAYYDSKLGEFLLPYEAVRHAPSPDDVLLAFLQSTYEAAAENGAWPRDALERELGPRR